MAHASSVPLLTGNDLASPLKVHGVLNGHSLHSTTVNGCNSFTLTEQQSPTIRCVEPHTAQTEHHYLLSGHTSSQVESDLRLLIRIGTTAVTII